MASHATVLILVAIGCILVMATPNTPHREYTVLHIVLVICERLKSCLYIYSIHAQYIIVPACNVLLVYNKKLKVNGILSIFWSFPGNLDHTVAVSNAIVDYASELSSLSELKLSNKTFATFAVCENKPSLVKSHSQCLYVCVHVCSLQGEFDE